MSTAFDEQTDYYATHFTGLDLSRHVLAARTYEECTFTGCNFSEATLSGCKLLDCGFEDCNLSLAKVSHTRFRAVTFAGCKLVGINWTSAAWQRLATAAALEFRDCILNDSSFLGLALQELVVEHCKARDVDWRDANLSGAKLCHTDLTHALFSRTNLSGADLTGAVGYDIDVLNNAVRGARFSRDEAVRLLLGLEIELAD